MEDPLGSHSDGRTVAPMAHCPRCGSAQLRSRDAPGGLEIACANTAPCVAIGSCSPPTPGRPKVLISGSARSGHTGSLE